LYRKLYNPVILDGGKRVGKGGGGSRTLKKKKHADGTFGKLVIFRKAIVIRGSNRPCRLALCLHFTLCTELELLARVSKLSLKKIRISL
jgi:hypothetical protein